MSEVFKFFVLALVGLYIFSATANECEEDICAEKKPAVDDNGNIVMTIWYDNDDVIDALQWNANMVIKACKAREYFTNKFSVEFIIGAGTRVSEDNELICKADCTADRLEGCAALLLPPEKFPDFVCCNNNGVSDHDCIKKLGVEPSALDDCVDDKQSDQLLMDNGNRRRNAGIPGCHVPEFSFNSIVDRCIKIVTVDDLKKAICDIFKKGNVPIDKC